MKPNAAPSRREANLAECQGVLGRYALYGEIAHGGMATVHLGRLLGPVGFSRTVAIKRLHAPYAKDPDFVSMFLDEARLAARIRHPNVVPTLDVVALEGELFLVLEYVQGESMARIIRTLREKGAATPAPIAAAIMIGVLGGLHAAHEARSELGEPLHLVHRDMSPQNIIVCVDGIARVLDFGIAKARGRVQTTKDGQLKGKLSYIAPEQLRHEEVDRRTDIYAAGVTLWEMLTGQRLHKSDSEWQTVHQILTGEVPSPSSLVATVPSALDAVVAKALQKKPDDRFVTARDMAVALERAVRPASAREVGEFIELHAGDTLRRRAERVAEVETRSAVATPGSAYLGADAASVIAAEGGLQTGAFASNVHPSGIEGLRQSGGETGSGRRSHPPRASQTPPGGALAGSGFAGPMTPGGGVGPITGTGSSPSVRPSSGMSAMGSGISAASVLAGRTPSAGVPAPVWPSEAPPPRRGLLVAGLLLLGVLAGIAMLFVWRQPEVDRPSAAMPTASTPAATVSAVPVRAAAAAEPKAPEPIVDEAPPAEAHAARPVVRGVAPHVAPARPAPTPRAAATPVREAPTAAPAPAPAAPAPAPVSNDDCNPPYTIDAAGIRHPKAQCL